jgi:hypothetical protein
MRKAEQAEQKQEQGTPGKSGPAIIAFTCPRPPLGGSTKEPGERKTPLLPSLEQRGEGRFSGAYPVASVLGIRAGATPHGHIHPNTQSSAARPEQDISTLLGLGHFYFALTTFHPASATVACALHSTKRQSGAAQAPGQSEPNHASAEAGRFPGTTDDPNNPFTFAPRTGRCTVGSLTVHGAAS